MLILLLHFLVLCRPSYRQAMNMQNEFLCPREFAKTDRLNAFKAITYEDICDFAKSNSFIKGLTCDALIQGALSEDDASRLLSEIEKTLCDGSDQMLQESTLILPKIVDLRDGENAVRIRSCQQSYNHEETNSATCLSIKVRFSLILFQQMPDFRQDPHPRLRTGF